MAVGFADNALAAGDFTQEWVTVRFTYTPIEGPFRNRPIKVAGFWEFSGDGYTREGVTPIYDASGTGEPVKMTKGRFKANECTAKHDPQVWRDIIEPRIAPKGSQPYRFNLTIQKIDPAGVATQTEQRLGCITTGVDYETPNDGNPFSAAHKFSPRIHR